VKRLLACVSLVAVTTTAVGAAPTPADKPTPKPVPAHKKAAPIRVAPADEYFGKLKMSVLGIRNTIKDVGANIEIDQTRWAQLESKAAFAEDAMRDWEKKYPPDTWLAKMVFALERMYAKLDSDDGRKRSVAAMKWLVHDFPKSWYGRTGKTELAAGKVGRPAQTAAAASPAPGPDVVAAPAVLTSAAPAPAGVSPSGPVSAEEASGGVAATPVPNPLPSMSPGARSQNR
jgi:hypothetical protein